MINWITPLDTLEPLFGLRFEQCTQPLGPLSGAFRYPRNRIVLRGALPLVSQHKEEADIKRIASDGAQHNQRPW